MLSTGACGIEEETTVVERPGVTTRATPREIGSALKGGFWAILFPICLLLGLRMGVFTPSEIGAFAVFYGLFIGVLIYALNPFSKKKFQDAANIPLKED